jgi:hypothetical protein
MSSVVGVDLSMTSLGFIVDESVLSRLVARADPLSFFIYTVVREGNVLNGLHVKLSSTFDSHTLIFLTLHFSLFL